jgi:hypothetical protein
MARVANAQASGASAARGGGPGHGRVLRADVPAGSPVAPGMVVAVVTSGPVVLRLDLPEALAAKVRPARKCASRAWRRGHVTRIYPAVQGGQVRPMSPWPGSTPPDRAAYAASLAAGTHRATRAARFVTTRYGLDYVRCWARTGPRAGAGPDRACRGWQVESSRACRADAGGASSGPANLGISGRITRATIASPLTPLFLLAAILVG